MRKEQLMIKKMLLIGLAIAFLGVPVFAGDLPEIDSVGCDKTNVFTLGDAVKKWVTDTNVVNACEDSNFTGIAPAKVIKPEWREKFDGPSAPSEDSCFKYLFPGYKSQLVIPVSGKKTYLWRIVLQYVPQSDLDINIRDCVLKNNSDVVFGCSPLAGSEQTGRYTWPDGSVVWVKGINPSMTVTAYPGPYAEDGFSAPFILHNRLMGTLNDIPFNKVLYTSKAIWEEGLVARMPQSLVPAPVGLEYTLSAGDIIEVKIEVPAGNAAFIRYGQDNIAIKYIGVCGTGISANDYPLYTPPPPCCG
jgi:hypothetical protein